jgi:hypothetical protein
MSLLALQQDFRAWLHVGQGPSDPRISGEARAGLDVYRNNYRGQIVACLEESFAVTRAWLGEAAFQDAIFAHTGRKPPHSWSLDHFPDDFPSTLARLYPGDAEVTELATLELALSHAFVAADAVPVVPGDLAGVEWDRARLHLTPSLRMYGLTTNAPAIWWAITAETMPPPVELLPNRGEILVWRHDETPRFRTTDQAEADALRHIDKGMNFGLLCAALVDAGGDDPAAVAGQWLAQWISDGLIIEIEGETRCVN